MESGWEEFCAAWQAHDLQGLSLLCQVDNIVWHDVTTGRSITLTTRGVEQLLQNIHQNIRRDCRGDRSLYAALDMEARFARLSWSCPRRPYRMVLVLAFFSRSGAVESLLLTTRMSEPEAPAARSRSPPVLRRPAGA